MKYEDFAKLAVDNNDFISYVVDLETNEILYINEAAKNAFQISSEEDLIGKNCHDFLATKNTSLLFCESPDTAPDKKIRHEVLNHSDNRHYSIIESIIEIEGRRAKLIFGYDSSNQKKEFNNLAEKLLYEETLLKCINTLKDERDIDEAIQDLLSIVGEFYEADRAYIFEFDYLKNLATNTYEWSASEELAKIKTDPILNMGELIPIFESFEEHSQFIVSDIYRELDHSCNLFRLLHRKNVKSTLLTPFIAGQSLSSFIGVDNPKKIGNHLNLLRSVVIFVADDIKKRKLLKKLEYLSYTDVLTGLHNRNRYLKLLEEIETDELSSLGYIHATINGLKKLNELYGDHYGDKILKKVADILSNHIDGKLFRLSGDEFVAICQNISKQDFDKLISTLRKKSTANQQFSFSIGGVWQDRKIDIRQGLSQAGDIMFAEKQNYYKEKESGTVQTRANAIEILLKEIRSNAFTVYFQPKVALATGKIVEAEALIRKTGDNGKIIPPDRFIPIYENEGTIRHLDFFVLEEVCIFLQKLIKNNLGLKIAVNFSRVTFIAYDLVSEIINICAKYEIPHKYIKIEITESIDKMNHEFFNIKLNAIKSAGFDVSLDDFGAKHSNLLMLTSSEFSEVKIDKSLIDNIVISKQNRIVVRNIINTIKELGTSECLAEGIENIEQRNMLLDFGCKYGQGYYFYRPMTMDHFLDAYAFSVDIPDTEYGHAKSSKIDSIDIPHQAILSIINTMPLSMSLWDKQNKNIFCNKHMTNLLGLSSVAEYQKETQQFSPKLQPDGRTSDQAGFAFMEEARTNGYAKQHWLFLNKNKEDVPTEISLYRLDVDPEYGEELIVAFVRDLRPQLAINEESRNNNYIFYEEYKESSDYFFNEITNKRLFETITELSAEWFWVYNNKTEKIQFFGKGREILALPSNKIPFPGHVLDVVYEKDLPAFLEFAEAMKGGIVKPTEARFILPNGKIRYFNIIYKVIYDHNHKPIFSIGKTYDIEENKSLMLVSQKDLLTNSYNKITTENLISEILEKSDHLNHVMFIIDIDDFKGINDNLGHHFGDLVLAELGKNLNTCFREGDIIGRIGGDEFVVFVQNISDQEAIVAKAKAIINAFNESSFEGYGKFRVSGSVGIAQYPLHGKNYEELYINADKALYDSKLKGKNCYNFYSPKLED